MKSIFIALLLLTASFSHFGFHHSNSTSKEQLRLLFDQWKSQNNKEYGDELTEQYRFEVFVQNYNIVQSWNAEGNSAILALNKFADLTSEEFGSIYTRTRPMSEQDIIVSNFEVFDELQGQSEVNWVAKGKVTPVKNQEQCGSCWAFSTVATIESLYAINGNTLTSFSEQQIVDCNTGVNQGCNGGMPYIAMQYVASNGLETENDYPYTGV